MAGCDSRFIETTPGCISLWFCLKQSFQFHVKESTGISNICEIFFKKLQLQFRQEHVTCRRILNSVVNKKR